MATTSKLDLENVNLTPSLAFRYMLDPARPYSLDDAACCFLMTQAIMSTLSEEVFKEDANLNITVYQGASQMFFNILLHDITDSYYIEIRYGVGLAVCASHKDLSIAYTVMQHKPTPSNRVGTPTIKEALSVFRYETEIRDFIRFHKHEINSWLKLESTPEDTSSLKMS